VSALTTHSWHPLSFNAVTVSDRPSTSTSMYFKQGQPSCRISSNGSSVPHWLQTNPSSHDGFTWSWLFSVHVVSLASCIWLIAESHFDWITLRNYCISCIGFTATLMLQTGTPHLQLLQVAAPVKRARVTRAPSFECFGWSPFCLFLQKFTWGLGTGFGE